MKNVPINTANDKAINSVEKGRVIEGKKKSNAVTASSVWCTVLFIFIKELPGQKHKHRKANP
jgi:hypothetical protein